MKNTLSDNQFCSKRVAAIQVRMSTTMDIENRYPIEINNYQVNDQKTGTPHTSGVNSLLLGTSMFKYYCSTCNCEKTNCPGHNGHVKLAKPIIHPLCHEKLIKELERICDKCKRVTIPKNKKCDNCGSEKQQYKDDQYNLCLINVATEEKLYPIDI
jgi:DNA-directed RNA polymerase beta' subunit